MPRKPRFVAPGLPIHVIQRGNNKAALFTSPAEYRAYAEFLLGAITRYECLVHAYVLMTNHVHLLITPRRNDGVGKVMQSLGGRYVRHFNDRHHRTGTLWEGRYRATLVESGRYLLACYRYIELNPVRAGLVREPLEYRWSSHGSNAFGIPDRLVSPHATYLDLAREPVARYDAYRALFRIDADPVTLAAIRRATNFSWPLGGPRFLRDIGAQLNRRVTPLRAGRPRGKTRKMDSDPDYREMGV